MPSKKNTKKRHGKRHGNAPSKWDTVHALNGNELKFVNPSQSPQQPQNQSSEPLFQKLIRANGREPTSHKKPCKHHPIPEEKRRPRNPKPFYSTSSDSSSTQTSSSDDDSDSDSSTDSDSSASSSDWTVEKSKARKRAPATTTNEHVKASPIVLSDIRVHKHNQKSSSTSSSSTKRKSKRQKKKHGKNSKTTAVAGVKNKSQDVVHTDEPLGAQTIPLPTDATALTIPPDSTAAVSFEGRVRRAPAKVTGTINLQVPLSANPVVQFEVVRDGQVSVSRGQQYLIKSARPPSVSHQEEIANLGFNMLDRDVKPGHHKYTLHISNTSTDTVSGKNVPLLVDFFSFIVD